MKKLIAGILIVGIGIGFSTAFGTSPVYSEKAVTYYLSQLSSMLAGRPLTQDELTRIKNERGAAIEHIVSNWLYDRFFPESAKVMIQTQLHTSGSKNGINFSACKHN